MVDKNSTESRVIKKSVLPGKKNRGLSILNRQINDDSNDLDDDDSDNDSESKLENSSKVKYLPPSVIKDIEQKNVARKLAGLPPIMTRIRHCLTCGAKFQSAGNRTCGCASRIAGIIAGREII